MSPNESLLAALVEPYRMVPGPAAKKGIHPAWLALLPAALAISFFVQAHALDGSMPWDAGFLAPIRATPAIVLPSPSQIHLAMAWTLAYPALAVAAYMAFNGILALKGRVLSRAASTVLMLTLGLGVALQAAQTIGAIRATEVAVTAHDAGYAQARSVLVGKGMAEAAAELDAARARR